MARYLFIGYYGHNNLGDEAMLYTLYTSFQKQDDKAICFATTTNLEASLIAHENENIEFIPLKKGKIKLINRIRLSDYLIIPGGYVVTSTSIKKWCVFALLSKLFRTKFIIGPVGTSIISGPVNKLCGKIVYKIAKSHATRDERSFFNIKNSISVESTIRFDVTLNLGMQFEHINVDKTHIGLNIRAYGKNEIPQYETFIRIAKAFSEKGDSTFNIFSSSQDNSQNDLNECYKLQKMLHDAGINSIVVEPQTVNELVLEIKSLDICFSTRLHVVLLALSQNRLSYGISNAKFWKIDEVLKSMDLGYLLINENISTIQILELIDNKDANYKKMEKDLLPIFTNADKYLNTMIQK